MNSLRSLVLLAAATLLLSACSTAPRETAQSTPAAGTESSKNLRRGMTEDQIRAVWGEPQTIHPGNEGVKLLVYQ
ncbi:MAG TPA: hypothetical protein VHN79_02630, partial [Lacunisphaera sp.]|nr:hypothetical protein [Lacunisphaera sp.]